MTMTPNDERRSGDRLSWDVWNRLRAAQGCSVARARHALVVSVTALVDHS